MKTAHDLVLAAKQAITEVSAATTAHQLQGDCLLLDVREPAEFAAGHLPGAINVPRGMLEFRIASLCPQPKQPLLLYCKSSGRAALAAMALQDMGYTGVSSLAGGYDQWLAEGHPVLTPEAPAFD